MATNAPLFCQRCVQSYTKRPRGLQWGGLGTGTSQAQSRNINQLAPRPKSEDKGSNRRGSTKSILKENASRGSNRFNNESLGGQGAAVEGKKSFPNTSPQHPHSRWEPRVSGDRLKTPPRKARMLDGGFNMVKHFSRASADHSKTLGPLAPDSSLDTKRPEHNRRPYGRQSKDASLKLRKVESVGKTVEMSWMNARIEEGFNWYWETLPPSWAQKSQANLFFSKHARATFLKSVPTFRTFPDSDVPEVAFVGRSNVGKSSLLNAITDTELLARTSSTRGFTKTMNIYGIAPKSGISLTNPTHGIEKITGTGGLTIVDMPGYGEGSLSEWGVEIMKYLQNRKQLRRVFVLCDAEHGLKEKDLSLLASLRLGGIPHQVILSKLDKIYLPQANFYKSIAGHRLFRLKPKGTINEVRLTMSNIRSLIQPASGAGALGELLGCSTEVLVDGKRLGIDALRFAIIQSAGLTLGPQGKVREDLVRAVYSDQTQAFNRFKPETEDDGVAEKLKEVAKETTRGWETRKEAEAVHATKGRDEGEKLLLASLAESGDGLRRTGGRKRRVRERS